MKHSINRTFMVLMAATLLAIGGCNEGLKGDIDSDGDTVLDSVDLNPLNNMICADEDGDGCDDCSVAGKLETANDGLDTDTDSACNAGDSDDDNDEVADADDREPLNKFVCADEDGDTCEDCRIGQQDLDDDGRDTDRDGACDGGDEDDDGDSVQDGADFDALNKFSCSDDDRDGCDDCILDGVRTPSHDGMDTDGNGKCDLRDSDGDTVENPFDSAPGDSSICRDLDADGCDDCGVQHVPNTNNDGVDLDSDSFCDFGGHDTSRPTTSECRVVLVVDSDLPAQDKVVPGGPAVHTQQQMISNGIIFYRDECVSQIHNAFVNGYDLPRTGCKDKATIAWAFSSNFAVKDQASSGINQFASANTSTQRCPEPPGGILASRVLECMGFGPNGCKLSDGKQNSSFTVSVPSSSFLKRVAFVANDHSASTEKDSAKLLVQYRQTNGNLVTLFHDKVRNMRDAANADPISISVNDYSGGQIVFTRGNGPIEVRNLNVYGR